MSQDNNGYQQFFSQNDFTKAFGQYQNLPFDMTALLETQRKNIQAIADAQQVAFENLQGLAQHQSKIISQLVEDNAAIAQQMMSEGTPEEKIAKNADAFKFVYEKSVANLKEISEMVGKSSEETSKIINKRVSASISELKSAIDKAPETKKAA